MDWHLILSNALTTALGPQRHRLRAGRHRPQRPLRLHGPGELRPGRLRRGRAPTRSPWASTPTGCRSGSAFPSWSPHGRPRPDPRCPDPAPAGRLPRHRHDRGGGDHPARAPLGALRLATGGADGLQNFADDFERINPFAPAPTTSSGAGRQRVRPVHHRLRVDPRGAGVGLVYFLMRSPWGRVLKAIREDEDAVRSLGKNVYSYKMQSLDHRRRHRRGRRHRVRGRPSGRPRTASAPPSPSSPTWSSCSAARRGCSVRWSARSSSGSSSPSSTTSWPAHRHRQDPSGLSS